MKERIYRQGAVGALLDEYERAANELKEVISTLDQKNYTTIVDRETNDPDCRSVLSIMNHVVRSGYGYANYILKQFNGKPLERKENYEVSNPANACAELDKMLSYSVEALADKTKITYEEILNNVMTTTWGQKFDFDQLMEHAIVHILRHRRQIEIFKLKTQKVR